MPYSFPDNIPRPALNWTEAEQKKCIAAANAVLSDNGSEQDAIYACIHAAGKTENPGGEGKAVKIASETDRYVEIEGLAIPYIGPLEGNKDFDGERFTKDTDLCLEWFPAGRPLLYHHGHDEKMSTMPIGRQVKSWELDAGRWASAQIDKSGQYWEEIKELVAQGRLFFSSGALAHLKLVDDDGNIQRWPWAELSLTPTPANPYAVTMPSAKKAYKAAGLEFTIPEQEGEAKEALERAPAEPTEAGEGGISQQQETNMSEEITAAVMAAFKAQEEAEQARLAAEKKKADEKAAFEEAVKAAVQEELKGTLAANKMVHADGKDKPSGIVVASKYDTLDDVELDIMACYIGKSKQGWSEKLRNKLIAKHGDRGQLFTSEQETAQKAIASMDLTDTTNWVPTVWENALWRKLRLENKVAGLFRHIDLPANTYELPTESTDPTVYRVTESTAGTPTLSTGVTPSQSADTKVQLSTSKLGARVWISGELEEDSAFPIIPLIKDQMNRKMEDAIEFIILSGDTATDSANVSTATPATTAVVRVDNGLRKYCLITQTGQGTSVGELTFDDLVTIRYLLGKQGVNPANLAFITDYRSYLKRFLALDDFMTLDKYGNNAIIMKGELGKVMGIPVIVSENLDLTGTNGKVISGGTVGSILCVARDRWICGWRRHMKFWSQYYGHEDRTDIVVLARFCFAGFNETDGTDVALGYNVTL